MPLVSITRLRVRSLRYLPAFIAYSLGVAHQAKSAPGNLAVSLLGELNFAFWTRTLWADERAMRGFMVSGAHRSVMPRLPNWCDEAAVAHWDQESLDPPSWQEVHRRMLQDGRPSPVDHPSEAQRRFEMPPPPTRGELRIKLTSDYYVSSPRAASPRPPDRPRRAATRRARPWSRHRADSCVPW